MIHCTINIDSDIPDVTLETGDTSSHNENIKQEPCNDAIDWKKVTANDSNIFKENLNKVLNHVPLPEAMLCHDHKCNNINHKNEIDKFTDDIMSAMVDASNHLPKIRKKKKKNTNKVAKAPWSNDL